MNIDTRRTHDRQQHRPVDGIIRIAGAGILRRKGYRESLQLADAGRTIDERRSERGIVTDIEETKRSSADLVEAGRALKRVKEQPVSGANARFARTAEQLAKKSIAGTRRIGEAEPRSEVVVAGGCQG